MPSSSRPRCVRSPSRCAPLSSSSPLPWGLLAPLPVSSRSVPLGLRQPHRAAGVGARGGVRVRTLFPLVPVGPVCGLLLRGGGRHPRLRVLLLDGVLVEELRVRLEQFLAGQLFAPLFLILFTVYENNWQSYCELTVLTLTQPEDSTENHKYACSPLVVDLPGSARRCQGHETAPTPCFSPTCESFSVQPGAPR